MKRSDGWWRFACGDVCSLLHQATHLDSDVNVLWISLLNLHFEIWIWCCCRWGSSGRSPPLASITITFIVHYHGRPICSQLPTATQQNLTISHNRIASLGEHKTIPKDFWEPHVALKRPRGSNLRSGQIRASIPIYTPLLGPFGNWEERIEDPITLISAICEWWQFAWTLCQYVQVRLLNENYVWDTFRHATFLARVSRVM